LGWARSGRVGLGSGFLVTIFRLDRVMLGYFLRSRLVREIKFLGPLPRSIRSVEHKLFTKIITRMDRKLRDEFIKSN
jgi:hypothetical protein